VPAESTTPDAAADTVQPLEAGLRVYPEGAPLGPGTPSHPLSRLVLPKGLALTSLMAGVHAELVCFADDTDGLVSSSRALDALAQRSLAIGQSQPDDANEDSPLARASARHAAAEQALRDARSKRSKTRDQALRRLELLDELDRLRARQAQLRAELERGTLAARARKLADASEIKERLDETTQRCFALSSLREFPLDQEAALQRADRRAAEANDAHDAACVSLDEVTQKLDAEQVRVDATGGEWLQPLPDDWETTLGESDAKVAAAQAALDAATAARDEVTQRLENAESALRHLPDFGQFAGDPMEWVGQMTTTFATNLRMRNGERALRDELRALSEKREASIAGPRRLFLEGEGGILAQARALDTAVTAAHEKAKALAEEDQSLQSYYREVEASIPGFRGMAALMAVATPALGFITFVTRNPGLIYALAGVALALAFFAFSFLRARRGLTRIRLRLNQIGPESERARAAAAESSESLEVLLAKAGVTAVRELDASYEQYCKDKAAAESVARDLAAQEVKTDEAEQHTAALFANLRETFQGIGEEIVEEADVPEAAQRALSTYQQYRDAKRRRAESRDLLQRRAREVEEAESALAAATQEDVRLSLQAREQLRRAGFADERKHAGALHALRAYRLRHAQQRTRQGRMELLEERRRQLTARVEGFGRARDEAAHTLDRLLAKAGVETVDEWFARADDARTYRAAWSERTQLQEELDALLAGETLEELAAEIEAAGGGAVSDRSPETIQSELESVSGAIDEALEEAESLGGKLGPMDKAPTLNELEEDEACTGEALAILTAERRATGYAAAAIQDAARARRETLARRLSESATEWLQRLTGRTDASIAVSADLTPRADGAVSRPGLVALAMRVALLDILAPEDESVPLIVEGMLPLEGDAEYGQVLDALGHAATRRPVLWRAGPDAWCEAARARGTTVQEPVHAAGD